MKEKLKNEIVEKLKEGIGNMQGVMSTNKPRSTKVIFDKSTNPFEIDFSERGFEVEGERFSFEFIETSLSKNINITLNDGKGLVLDKIRMSKILKYKDLY